MKTQKEKLRICTVCNRREFEKNTGLFCSQTKNKPTFDTQCSDFAADIMQMSLKKNRFLQVYEEIERISQVISYIFLASGLSFLFYLIIDGIVDGNINGWVGAILLGSLLIALSSIPLIAVGTRSKGDE